MQDNQLEGGLYPWGPWSTLTRLMYLSAYNNSLDVPLPPMDKPFVLDPVGESRCGWGNVARYKEQAVFAGAEDWR